MSLSHTYPGPEDILRRELSNGIVVLARANYFSPSVAISGYLQAGSIHDHAEKLGLADFTASALMRGTQACSFQQIYERLEAVGAGLGFSGGTHTTSFNGRALAEDLPMLLSLLAETLRRPSFPARQVERLRAALLTSLDFQWQDSRDRAGMAFDEVVYPNHPYGQPDEGTPDTVRRIHPRDLKDYHRKYYGPRGLVISIVGGIEPEKAVSLVEAALGDWTIPGSRRLPNFRIGSHWPGGWICASRWRRRARWMWSSAPAARRAALRISSRRRSATRCWASSG